MDRDPEGTAAPQRIAVRVAESCDVTTALVQVALANGYFADAGLEVEAREYPSGKRSLEGQFAGKVDFAVAAETPIVISSLDSRVAFGSAPSCAGRDGIDRPTACRRFLSHRLESSADR